MDELIKIKERYKKRDLNPLIKQNNRTFYFYYFISTERELRYLEIFRRYFVDKNNVKIIEIGAGEGPNLYFLLRAGFQKTNIYANELLEDRFSVLKKNFSDCNLISGDASEINFKDNFDIVFQSTVFTSILDDEFKQKLADKMFEMVKEGGFILWYDFKYNNPRNPDVKGIKKKEIKKLFPHSKAIQFFNVTLAPPIGRKIGKLYPIVNFLYPFLRTHIIAVIIK